MATKRRMKRVNHSADSDINAIRFGYSKEVRGIMDPNANLTEQAILLTSRTYTPDYFGVSERLRLAELRSALRDWLNSGGFAPEWDKHLEATENFNLWRQRKKA